MTVGADVENGKYAMLGARIGCYKTVLDNSDLNTVRDLGALEKVFLDNINDDTLDDDLASYGESLRQRLDIPVAEFNDRDSKFFKFAMTPHVNLGVQQREQK